MKNNARAVALAAAAVLMAAVADNFYLGHTISGKLFQATVRENAELKGKAAEQDARHKFWSTQPVPRLAEAVSQHGPIEPPRTVAEVRAAPYSLPAGFEWCTIDVTDEAQVQSAVELAFSAFGGLHGVVNCAGIAPGGSRPYLIKWGPWIGSIGWENGQLVIAGANLAGLAVTVNGDAAEIAGSAPDSIDSLSIPIRATPCSTRNSAHSSEMPGD